MSDKFDSTPARTSAAESVATDEGVAGPANDEGQSRRHFTRSAVVGGAVLLTLGNRGAWGAAGTAKPANRLCVSQNSWESFIAPGFQISAAATEGHYDEVLEFAEYVEATGEEPKLIPGQAEYCIKLK